MNEVQRESKIRHEFASGYKEEDRDDSDQHIRFARGQGMIKELLFAHTQETNPTSRLSQASSRQWYRRADFAS